MLKNGVSCKSTIISILVLPVSFQLWYILILELSFINCFIDALLTFFGTKFVSNILSIAPTEIESIISCFVDFSSIPLGSKSYIVNPYRASSGLLYMSW